MLRKYWIFLVLISFLPSAYVFAWSATGHGLVGDIAYKYLSPLAKSRVNYYLKGRTVHQACTWMDSVKSLPAYSYLTPRHYLNIDKGATFDSTSTNNIYFELNRVFKELSQLNNLNDSMITQYVLEVFHLVGDLHQPLHCGYGSDVGGNSVRVTFLGQNTNLHSAWDYSLVQAGNLSLASCIAANQFTPAQIQTIQQLDVLEWMNESRQLVDTCYYTENNNNLDSNYLATRLPIVQQQLLKAGLRLASVLELFFGANSILPLQLLSFDVQLSNTGNTLFWETSSSKDVARFIIEKSYNGTTFNTVGTVESSLLNELSTYHFVDSDMKNQAYYRLKMLFNNGKTMYSTVINAKRRAVVKNSFNISPNPAKSFLSVHFNESDSKNVAVQLLGLDGKVYKTQQYRLNPGKVVVNFDLKGLAKGSYLLCVEGMGTKKVLVE